MMTRRMILRLVVSVTLLLGVMDVAAQMKVIPRERIDSIARPRMVEDSAVRLLGGGRVNLGDIAEADGVVERDVEWENTGREPIVITRLKSSCSCLTVSSGRDVVAPGERGVLRMRFNPAQRLGGVSYRVLVYSSQSKELPSAVIYVSGNVLSAVEGSEAYPHSCGELLLAHRRVTVAEGEPLRIACINGGRRSLHLKQDTLLTPKGVAMHTEPEVLTPGEKGCVVIECCDEVSASGQILLYIGGLQLPPRQRCIVLELKKK